MNTKNHSNDLVKRFMEKKVTKKTSFKYQIEKVDNLDRSTLLNQTNALRKNVILFLVKYSLTLSNIRKIIIY